MDQFSFLEEREGTVEKIFDLKGLEASESRDSLLGSIHAFYQKNGFVVLKALSSEFCKKAIKEQIEHILLKQPWDENHRLKVYRMIARRNGHDGGVEYKSSGDEVIYEDDPDLYLENLLKAPVDPKTLKRYERAWPLHKAAGACADHAVFHLQEVWNVRQNESLFQVATTILDSRELWVDINRSIQKLPGQGVEQPLRWDNPPIKKTPENEIKGKAVYTDSQFVCIPGSHTPEFYQGFARYKKDYGFQAEMAHKWKGIDFSSGGIDPLALEGEKRVYTLPAGSVVFWSSKLLHGEETSPKKAPIEFGMFFGYMIKESRRRLVTGYMREAKKRVAYVNQRFMGQGYLNGRPLHELEDRVWSFENGCAPLLFSNLDPVCFYPPGLRKESIEMEFGKMSLKGKGIYGCKEYNEKGVEINSALPWINFDYELPNLTDLGKRLLGLMDVRAPARSYTPYGLQRRISDEHLRQIQRNIDERKAHPVSPYDEPRQVYSSLYLRNSESAQRLKQKEDAIDEECSIDVWEGGRGLGEEEEEEGGIPQGSKRLRSPSPSYEMNSLEEDDSGARAAVTSLRPRITDMNVLGNMMENILKL